MPRIDHSGSGILHLVALKRIPRSISAGVFLLALIVSTLPAKCDATNFVGTRRGLVRVEGHSLVDDGGPFLGLGVSYFTALWRCKYDPKRLESDLEFLSRQGFNYYRMFSMVGWNGAWDGLEIAPVAFTSRSGKRVEAWPDYWQQLGKLIDIAYDRYGMRTQITIFADAQLMPDKAMRIAHMQRLLTEVVPGREHKILMLEVANEAWQNGFPGEQGVQQLREFTRYLTQRTRIPVAITSNHEGSFEDLYKDSSATLATWHFSRDKRKDDGWQPVYDCWRLGDLQGLPPVCSNEPIGPGSSVAAENDPTRLVMAAVFAYTAKLPAYVFHSGAGVSGKTQFEDMPAINNFGRIVRLLPRDLANWRRNDGKEPGAPFTICTSNNDGCISNIGSRKQDRFVCLPIGIRPGGLQLEARDNLSYNVVDPVTGRVVMKGTRKKGERLILAQGTGAFIIQGRVLTKAN